MASRINRLKELREQREDSASRLEAALDEWDTKSQVEQRITISQLQDPPKRWLTPERARAIFTASVTAGGLIWGLLQSIAKH